MNNIGICVLGHARPKYLFVTLDNLFRVRGIEKYNVHAFIDGSDEIPREQFIWVLSKFNLSSYFVRQKNVGMNRHVLKSIKDCFEEYGHDEVIVIEHDDIFSIDFLEYSESLDMEDYFALCLGRASRPERLSRCATSGWRIGRKHFYDLLHWINTSQNEYWIDPLDPTKKTNIFIKDKGWDGLMATYVISNGLFCHFCAEKNHGGNFGVIGLHSPNDSDRIKYNDLFFRGPISRWIWNVAILIKEGAYSESVKFQFFPKEWDGLLNLLEQTQPAYKFIDANMLWPF